MPSSNPIIALAERSLQEQFSRERRRQEFEALVTKGIEGQDVYEALQTVLTPACPTPLVEVVTRICTDLASAAGQDELAAVTHFHVGNVLSNRYDRLSLELAIQHFQAARRGWDPRNPNYGSAQMNEGGARGRLAELGVEPRAHLEEAVALCKAARHSFPPKSPDAGRAQLNEGIARLMLAEYGNDPIENVQAAVALYQDARDCFAPKTPDYGRALTQEGRARHKLATSGVNPIENVQAAVALYQDARDCFAPETSADYGKTLVDEGRARMKLAEFDADPIKHLRRAVALCQEARTCCTNSFQYGWTLISEADAQAQLARLGIEPVPNLQAAVALYRDARECLAPETPDYREAQASEGAAWLMLAKFSKDPIEPLQAAVALCQQARQGLAPESSVYGARVHEAIARLKLAEFDKDPIENLQAAVALCQEARRGFTSDSREAAMALITEGSARMKLAELEVEPEVHLHEAVALYEQGAEDYAVDSIARGEARCNQARALRQLGRLEEAYQRLKEGLHVVEDVRAQMRREPERIAFLETMAVPYTWMVGLCIELANSAATPEQKDQWRWEAWHWVQRGKSRALLELLANLRPRLTEAELPLWEAYQQSAQALDRREREIQYLRARRAKASDDRLAAQQAARLAELERERAQLQQAYEEKRHTVLETIEGARVFETVAVPPPQQVVESLRQLAGLCPSSPVVAQRGSSQEGAACKPLMVDFFTVSTFSDAEIAVFLLPLWEDTPPLIQRLQVAHETVCQMAGSLLEALATLPQQTRAGHRGPTGEASPAACTAAEAHLAQLPAELSVFLKPWMAAVDQWQPTELVLSPHLLLNLLPLHAALWQGKPLIEQYPIVYLPSAALAQELLRPCKPVGGEALLLGNPTGDLKGAEREVAWVAKSLKRAGMPYNKVVRQQAITSYVNMHAPAARILHFACHSVLDVADFLRSGVELADRRLTVLDVSAGLELAQAALVCLNSCDSAQAVPGRMDELMALVRVFLYAGSPSVIASLWALHDGAAATFATHFYARWVGAGEPLAVAFQQAMILLKNMHRDYANPFYWAPFVLMGYPC